MWLVAWKLSGPADALGFRKEVPVLGSAGSVKTNLKTVRGAILRAQTYTWPKGTVKVTVHRELVSEKVFRGEKVLATLDGSRLTVSRKVV